jgi:hypothetical protein
MSPPLPPHAHTQDEEKGEQARLQERRGDDPSPYRGAGVLRSRWRKTGNNKFSQVQNAVLKKLRKAPA